MPQQGHFSLGIEGLALLRLWLTGDEEDAADRITEVGRIMHWLEANPQGSTAKLTEWDARRGYNLWASSYDLVPNVFIDLEGPAVRALLEEAPRGRALDAACGTGRHLAWLQSAGCEAVGIDLTGAMLARARDRGCGLVAEADVLGLPFPDGTFDLTVCSLALTHLKDLAPPIAELGRVTRAGGTVIISDIHPVPSLTGCHALVREEGKLTGFVRNEVHWHGHYLAAFAAHGLSVRRCLEPKLTGAEVGFLAGRSAASDPAAAPVAAWKQALQDIPAVLVWSLQKE